MVALALLLFERRKLLKRDRKLILGTSDRSTGVQLAVRKGFDPKHSMGLISYVEHTYIYIYIYIIYILYMLAPPKNTNLSCLALDAIIQNIDISADVTEELIEDSL